MVVHDEIDLAAGKLKVKTGGGDAGQNGLRSITATLGPDYRRVRLGIGHPGEKTKVTGHVLQNFSKDDIDWLKPLVEAMVEAAPLLAKDDDAGFMSKVALAAQAAETGERAKEERRVMGFKCGIVGLPNVGKSTLFNALTQTAAAQAANYPFCTIEPNVGDVAVPDRGWRLWPRSPARPRSSPPASLSWTLPGWCAAPPRAKGWATSSWPISAKWMRWPMCCAVSRMTTSPMSRARSIPSAMPRRWRPN